MANSHDKRRYEFDLMNIGNVLRILREKHKMTQLELAKKCKVNRSTISRWERISGSITIGGLTNILFALNERLDLVARIEGPGVRPNKKVCRSCKKDSCMEHPLYLKDRTKGAIFRVKNSLIPPWCKYRVEHTVCHGPEKQL